jgi:uncharacterized membrane-anchored protein
MQKQSTLATTDEEQGNEPTSTVTELVHQGILKIPPLTIVYWCEKMTATTFGETFADFFTQTLGFGYTNTSMILISVFIVFLALQIRVKSYWPLLFWAVMSTSSIAGTCISDFIDRTLHWGYPLGMGVLLSILLCIIAFWKLSGEYMSVEGPMTRRAEAFYWSTILVSNTLGTALGDFMSDSLSLGFGASAGIIGGVLCILAFLAYFTKTSRVVLFWIAFVLTRPFGATFGDLLTKSKKKGGLDLGTLNASMVILALFAISFAVELFQIQQRKFDAKLLAVTQEKQIVDEAEQKTNDDVEEASVGELCA